MSIADKIRSIFRRTTPPAPQQRGFAAAQLNRLTES